MMILMDDLMGRLKKIEKQLGDDDADLSRAHENFERVWRMIDDINDRLLKLERRNLQ